MTTETISESPPKLPPPNPFKDLGTMGSKDNRRVLGYEAEIHLPNSNKKRVPMQLFEGTDIYPPLAQLLERCRWYENRCLEMADEINQLMAEEGGEQKTRRTRKG